MRARNVFFSLTLLAGLLFASGPMPARADHGLPALQPAFVDYTPIGHYGPPAKGGTSATVPNPGSGPPPLNNPNPTGKWVAYDTNVWESLTMPYRHPGDNCNSLPEDQRTADCLSGDLDNDASNPVTRTGYTGYQGPHAPAAPTHGTCPPSPEIPGPWGQCFNNQLEYLDYYEHSMETSFADLGLIVKRYPFISPGTGSRGVALDASGGQAYNITATIPGADHPEETVLVGAHYDFTDSGPAAAWDSAEGHTEVMRMAYIMADYYRDTGTRPSATLKFVPWDSEESGTHGSRHYVQNNIPPGEFDEVRGYFNVDPCAGAYPAFEEGTNSQRTQVLQLANPAAWEHEPEIKARMEAWNGKAVTLIDQVLNRLDDRITRPGGTEVPIFVSNSEATAGSDDVGSLGGAGSDRGKIVTAVGGLFLFGSDYARFEEVGIPIFNFFPDYFGPHADIESNPEGSANASTKGLEILHTNNDNLTRINKLTSGLTDPGEVIDPSGLFASEGWAKGMEFCAQVEAWGMLQPEMAGTQAANTNVVAYYEALPNEAVQQIPVTFDATGTYQYSNVGTRAMHDSNSFTYEWDFGDGTSGTGKSVQHAYAEIGRYNTTLTVTGVGGSTDTMSIPVEVIGSNFVGPILDAIQPEVAKGGNFELNWEFDETSRDGFQHYRVEESFDYQQLFGDDAENIDLNWKVTPPTDPAIQPWQHSDSDTEKFRGNQMRSGQRSFWTGMSTADIAGLSPAGASSTLTLKNPITVPITAEPELSYWSLFVNEPDERGLVQIALTDGSIPENQLDWNTVDEVVGVSSCGQASSLSESFRNRSVDLGSYKGKQILVRFKFTLGPTEFVNVHPCGWYVEDISVGAGTWNPLDETTDKRYLVLNRPNNLWAYRVKGVYNDGVTTAASNVEIADVTDSRRIPKKDLLRCLRIKGKHILGSVKKDKLIGTDGPEVICGFAGNDKIRALGGDDVALGFKGKDKIGGGNDDDRLLGDQAKDRLKGGKGRDKLKGGKGKDRLNGGPGKDRCGKSKKDRRKKC